jgi:hypothetical protein
MRTSRYKKKKQTSTKRLLIFCNKAQLTTNKKYLEIEEHTNTYKKIKM